MVTGIFAIDCQGLEASQKALTQLPQNPKPCPEIQQPANLFLFTQGSQSTLFPNSPFPLLLLIDATGRKIPDGGNSIVKLWQSVTN